MRITFGISGRLFAVLDKVVTAPNATKLLSKQPLFQHLLHRF
jgi:hypothetical protein